jgi:ribonuclease BN (tRNA processing enzyme)
MKLHTLGTRSVDQTHNESLGFIVEYEGKKILLDCGVYAVQQMYRSYGLTPYDLDEVFISHSHVDHWIGLPWLLNSFAFQEYYAPNLDAHNISLIFPAYETKLIELIDTHFSYMYDDKSKLSLRKVFVNSGDTLGTGLSFMNVPHAVPNLGLKLISQNKTFCYLPDILEFNESIVKFVEDCDFLLISIAAKDARAEEMKSFGFATSSLVASLCNTARVKKIAYFHSFFSSDVEVIYNELREVLVSTQVVRLHEIKTLSI